MDQELDSRGRRRKTMRTLEAGSAKYHDNLHGEICRESSGGGGGICWLALSRSNINR
jgi:hypothetical protein